MNINDVVRSVPIFEGLNDEELELLISQGKVQNYPKNSVFINEGDQSNSLFIILEGKAKVFLSDEEGKEVILGIEGAGGFLGEIALLDSEPRSASVMTTEKTRVLIVSRDLFQSFILSNPEIALGIIRGLTKRMRGLISNVRNLALKNVYRRLVGTLQSMAEDEDGMRVVHTRLTHQDLADIIGASREMVSRILKDLHNGGYLETRDRKIYILKNPPSGW